MNKRWVVLLAGLAVVFSAAMTLAREMAPETPWQVLGNGGGHATGENVIVNDTLGQPFVGWSKSETIDLHAGYWTGRPGSEHKLYLPVVIRLIGGVK